MLLVILAAFPLLAWGEETVRDESVVTFNTACARCHEGECSGRMTFHLPKDSANQHIERHGGKLTSQTIDELFELLRYMKEECSFYPLSPSLVEEIFWDVNQLSSFKSHSETAYFLPLGDLDSGTYRLLFSGLSHSEKFCAEIINDEFDFIDKINVSSNSAGQSLSFRIPDRTEYYLRITARSKINLNRVELIVEKEISTKNE